MRIRHFCGYGIVSAKKTSLINYENEYYKPMRELKVLVSGDHEQGVEMRYPDESILFHWLVRRFDKSVTDYKKIAYYKVNSLDYEHCEYVIDYFI